MSQVLIIENDPILRDVLTENIRLAGHSFLTAKDGKEALALLERCKPVLILSDIDLAKQDNQHFLTELQCLNLGIPLILIASQNKMEDIIVMPQSKIDYLQKPFSAEILAEKVNLYTQLSLIDDALVARDPKSQALLSLALRVAQTDVGVMITGESGTGKEVLAHFIHDHSPRKQRPFIAINCAAIPEQMLEATLFGYEKGAFTGAYKSTAGKFEQAQGGTLLLDEVSEMSLPLQAKLLRVIQEKEVERIGANKLIALNVRILATSNRKLLDEVKTGKFREDLYYRLNIFPLHWLPLRERIHDVLPLTEYLIRKHCQANRTKIPQLSEEAKQSILSYNWPGNARELDNVVQRALVLQTEGIIEMQHLQLLENDTSVSFLTITKPLQTQEQNSIEQLLKEYQGDRQQVAAILGISERTLRYRLAKMREKGYVV